MVPERHVKLFKSGRNQAVQPAPARALLATLEPLEDTFPEISDPPPDPVEL